jgi:hypothetical protein
MFKQQPYLAACKASAALCLMLGVVACATVPMPNDKLALASASIQRAEQAGADQLAPIELRDARDKLTAAKASPHNAEGSIAAGRLADEADADARVAEAAAQAAHSQAAAAELDRSLAALRTESNKSTP